MVSNFLISISYLLLFLPGCLPSFFLKIYLFSLRVGKREEVNFRFMVQFFVDFEINSSFLEFFEETLLVKH